MERTQPRAGSGAARWTLASVATAVVSAVAASLCCLGPLAFAALGIGGAGLLVKFEPYRPLLSVVTVALLGAGFYFTYRKPAPVMGTGIAQGGDDCSCEMPRSNRLGRIALWISTILVVGFLASPYLIGALLG